MTHTLAAVAIGALALALAAAPSSAVSTTTLNPPTLPRGADVSIPHLEKRTIVDGTVRIRVAAPRVRLLGKSGTAYVVATAKRQGGGGKIWRFEANGTGTKLVRTNAWTTELSDDGLTIVSARSGRTPRSTVSTWSATTGALVAQRTFKDYVTILDAEGTRVMVGGFEIGTKLWDTATDTVTGVTRRVAVEADLSLDLLASLTKDPYQGGCTVVSSITRPGTRLWTSCTDVVNSFSTDGSRMSTTDILSDGIGPSAVTARTIAGKPVGNYKVNRGWFGAITWESPTALLLETHGPLKSATVRCVATACERAGDLYPTVWPARSQAG